jgi:hypothetical protein
MSPPVTMHMKYPVVLKLTLKRDNWQEEEGVTDEF